jgi:LPS-assembly lipoprotein|tara:strand:+ start:943 stop:1341 length:399 start_codon:yes stop_codon:yes gene_type:complete
MPFESLYIQASNPSVTIDIKRRIQASSKTAVLESRKDAQAILVINSAELKKKILSVSGTGRVREFQLRYSISFRVNDQKGREIVPDTKIEVNRVLPYSDSAILSAAAEENMLLKDMKKDAILKLMDRLGKVQ